MKRSTLSPTLWAFLAIFLWMGTSISNAQCIATSSFGSGTLDNTVTTPLTFTTCNFAGEYVPITVNSPGVYEFTSAVATDFITLTDASGTVITSGVQPLVGVINATGSYQVHYHLDPTCGTDFNCRTTTGVYLAPIGGCLPPAGLSSSNVGTTTADVSWTASSPAPANGYEYIVTTVLGTPAATASGTATTNNTVNLTGLPPATTHYVYLRQICASDTSIWVGPASFTTACVAFTAPLIENFDGPGLPNCWSTTNTAGGFGVWNYYSGSGFPAPGFGATGVTDNSGNGGGFMFVYGFDGNSVYQLETPIVDVTPLTAPAVSMSVFSNNVDFPGDNATLYINVFDGTTWNDSVWSYSGDFAGWVDVDIDISPYIGTGTNVRVQVVVDSRSMVNGAFYNDILVDNFRIQEAPACPNPTLLASTGIGTTTVDFGWTNGTSTAIIWDVAYGPVGFNPDSAAQTGGTLTNVFSNPAQLTGLTPGTTYQIYIREYCPNGTSTSNWVGPITVSTYGGTVSAFPYSEDFESGSGGWISSGLWELGAPTTTNLNSANSGTQAWGTDLDANYPNSSNAQLNSPIFDCSSCTGDMILSFALNTASETNWDGTYLEWSTDGVTWTRILNGLANWYNNAGDQWWDGTSGGYFTASTLVPGTMGQSNVLFRFVFESDGFVQQEGALMDDFNIVISPCAIPSTDSVTVAATSATSIDMSWAAADTAATSWEVEYGIAGFAQGSGTFVSTTTTNATFSPLTPGTTYEFYVREDCANNPGQSSAWIGPFSATTPTTPPYLQDWNAAFPGADWTQATGLIANPTTLTPATFGWSQDAFGNQGSPSANVNLFGGFHNRWLTSPSFDLGSTPTNWEISFDVAVTDWLQTTSGTMFGDDTLALVVSYDNGLTWNKSDILFAIDSLNNPGAGGQTFNVPISNIGGVVKFALYTQSTASNSDLDVFVDNFRIDVPAACPSITGLQVTGVTGNSVDLTWLAGTTGASSWEIEYGPAGFTQGTGTVVTVTSSTQTLINLAGYTTYDIYVRELCPNGTDFSWWSNAITVTTAIVPPFMETYDNGVQPAGWEQFSGDIATPSILTSTAFGGWSFGTSFGHDATYSSAVRNNVWSTMNQWLVSPSIDLGMAPHNYSLMFDAGLTQYFSSNSSVFDSDDSVFVVISTDNGVTWNRSDVLIGFDDTSVMQDTPVAYTVDLSPYNGMVKIAMYAESSGSTQDNDFFFDNFEIDIDSSNIAQLLCDNFDGYTTGGLSAQSNAWESWAGGAEDADVVSSPTFSGSGAMRIHETGTNGVSDIVYQMGDLTTGSHEVSFYFNIPTANGGYFNLMHDYDGGTAPVFAIEVLFDGTNGTGQLDYGSSGSGNIANFGFTPGTWNRMQIIVDLDADQAEMLVNGFSVATWTWSDNQGGVYESLGGIDFFSTAPGALTSLMYVDEFCFGDYVPACLVTTQPTGSDVDGCEGQATTLTATAGDTSNFVVWLDNSGQVLATGSNYTIDSLIATTTANAVDATELGAADHVGPLPSIATDGFGNFTNGTFITVYNTVRVDSMLIKSDGAVDMGVNFWSDDPANGGVLLQTSASASLPGAGEHQVAVNITLQPGTYFANVRYDGGAGQLFRATGGATFPYVLPDLISLDSINFVNQQRFYYLFDWVVTPVCLGTQPTAITANLVEAPSAAYTPTTTAGSCEVSFDASASVGDSYAWDFGDGSGASGATPTHTYSASGTYDVTLVVSNSCGNDTVVQQVTVDCIGLREDFLSSLNAYPNPTTDVLNIVFELQNRQDVQVRLMNSLGQIVYGEDLEAFSGVYEHQLSLENQAKGVYMLQVTTANGTKTMRVTLQ